MVEAVLSAAFRAPIIVTICFMNSELQRLSPQATGPVCW